MYIEATTLPDLWFQAIYNLKDHGTRKKVDHGSYKGQMRIEYPWFTGIIKYPGAKPLLPDIPQHIGIPDPVSPDYLDNYLPYLLTNEINPNEQYTYGKRIWWQIPKVIESYKKHGNTNNQNVLRVAQQHDIFLEDPPCLQLIDMAIIQGKLWFYPYFRSWELWAGLPANLAAIQLLKEYMAAEIGVKDGPMVVMSKGLHVYEYAADLIDRRLGR